MQAHQNIDPQFSGQWEMTDGKILGKGTGSISDSFIEIEVHSDISIVKPDEEWLGRVFSALYLRATSVGGTLFDARITGIEYGIHQGMVLLKFSGTEFARGLYIPSRDQKFSNQWSIEGNDFPIGAMAEAERFNEKPIDLNMYQTTDGTIGLRKISRTSLSTSVKSITCTSQLNFEFNSQISTEEFLKNYAQTSQALLEIIWKRRVSEIKYAVFFDNQWHHIIVPYLQEPNEKRKSNIHPSLINYNQLDYGRYFDFAQRNREIILLTADLVTGGTGFLQSQVLNCFILFDELLRIDSVYLSANIPTNADWPSARTQIIDLASSLGFGQPVRRKLAREHAVLIGDVENFLKYLASEFGFTNGECNKAIELFVSARNDVAHSLKSSIDTQTLISLRIGMTALGLLGVIRLIWGTEIALNSREGLKFELSELQRISKAIESN